MMSTTSTIATITKSELPSTINDDHNPAPPPLFCAKCALPIRDRFFLRALNAHWHEHCLRCRCCQCRLGDVGRTLFTRHNEVFCRSDYMRLFGNTGLCAACHKPIPAFEMVMRARKNVYHLECFACQQCGHRFCVGDRFYLRENRILCEADYAERGQVAPPGTGAVTTVDGQAQAKQPNLQALQIKTHLHTQQSVSSSAGNISLDALHEFSVFGLRSGGNAVILGSAAAGKDPQHVVVR